MKKFPVEVILESGIFNARWILTPFYVGLILSLFMLIYRFLNELYYGFSHINELNLEETTLIVLSLIDISLAGNLVLIIVFSGYENFVSKIDTGDSEDRPSWMGTLDFSGLKIKLIGSIVAISAISLLKAFMEIMQVGHPLDKDRLLWLLVLHLAFVASGVLFALMDALVSISHHFSARTAAHIAK